MPEKIEYYVDDLLAMMADKKASDLHLTVGVPPVFRINGVLTPHEGPKLLPPHTRELVYAMMDEGQIKRFELDSELDFAYAVARIGRFRVNAFKQRGSIGTVMRAIPADIPAMDKLGLPPITAELCMLPRGLILITGPTGSGKSTTLASMVDYMNTHRKSHIITVEDPIEFLHSHRNCVVNQREVGPDTRSFAEALRHVLRQDPDIILVGEMRDLETIQTAITAAETGHLVLATLHTTDAAKTVDRIIDVFASNQQQQIRLQLSTSLQAIYCQTLCRRIGGGRVAAIEVLIATSAVRNLIREEKAFQLVSVIQTSSKAGMQTLDSVLKDFYMKGWISIDEALSKCSNPAEFQQYVER